MDLIRSRNVLQLFSKLFLENFTVDKGGGTPQKVCPVDIISGQPLMIFLKIRFARHMNFFVGEKLVLNGNVLPVALLTCASFVVLTCSGPRAIERTGHS